MLLPLPVICEPGKLAHNFVLNSAQQNSPSSSPYRPTRLNVSFPFCNTTGSDTST